MANTLKFGSGNWAAKKDSTLTDSELETLVSYTSFNAMALNFNYTIY